MLIVMLIWLYEKVSHTLTPPHVQAEPPQVEMQHPTRNPIIVLLENKTALAY